MTRSPQAHAALWDAYRRAEYVVDTLPPLIIRMGTRSARRDRLVAAFGQREWAFITAWNPGSKVLGSRANHARHARLLARLDDEGLTWLSGRGHDPEGKWDAEESVFVIGCSFERAREIGAEFGQNAVVVGVVGGTARLADCSGSPT